MTEEKPTIGQINFEPMPLPTYWRAILYGWKNESRQYYTALTTIRHILQTEEDCHECCDKIEDVIKGVFET